MENTCLQYDARTSWKDDRRLLTADAFSVLKRVAGRGANIAHINRNPGTRDREFITKLPCNKPRSSPRAQSTRGGFSLQVLKHGPP